MSIDEMGAVLTVREYLYTVFRRTFAEPLDEEALRFLTDGQTRDGLAAFIEHDRFARMWSSLSGLEQYSLELEEELRGEYMRAFVGPTRLLAPPWESVYVNEDRALFQESTLAVRRLYASFGLVFSEKGKEADDHIALELEFMAYLCRSMREHFEEGRLESAEEALLMQKRFLDEHLLQWIDDFAQSLSKHEDTRQYALIAQLLTEFIHADALCVDELSGLLVS